MIYSIWLDAGLFGGYELSNFIKEISSGNEIALVQFYHDYEKLILASIQSIVKSRESAEEVIQFFRYQ